MTHCHEASDLDLEMGHMIEALHEVEARTSACAACVQQVVRNWPARESGPQADFESVYGQSSRQMQRQACGVHGSPSGWMSF